MLSLLREADIVVCHGGTGSLITALREGCRVIAMPRLFEKGEHYDNHQAEITEAFEARGLITVANSLAELSAALSTVRSKSPVMATSEPTALSDHLTTLLAKWGSAG
jgi:UDP-N-acetylglucosamine transferase subunit ALG13